MMPDPAHSRWSGKSANGQGEPDALLAHSLYLARGADERAAPTDAAAQTGQIDLASDLAYVVPVVPDPADGFTRDSL
jgi:hypothetical protein